MGEPARHHGFDKPSTVLPVSRRPEHTNGPCTMQGPFVSEAVEEDLLVPAVLDDQGACSSDQEACTERIPESIGDAARCGCLAGAS